MANSGMVLTFGEYPDVFLLEDFPKVPETEPQETPGNPFPQPGETQPVTEPGKSEPGETEPGETQPEETKPVSGPTQGTGNDQQKTDENVEIVVEECDHGIYPYLCIGTGVLSAALIVAVVLQALRLRKNKKRITELSKRKTQAAAPAVPVAAPSDKIKVGKLHAQGARSSQQDCLAVSPIELYPQKGVLALVADGMGGLSDGDRMSQAAASAMMNGFMTGRDMAPADLILALTAEANQAVNRVLGPQNQGKSGTTLVGGVVRDGMFHYVSVGDSRICLFRQGQLTQLNREHVYRNELATHAINGAGTLWDANNHPKAGALTSYLGMGALKYVDIAAEPVKLRGGDKIVLMSDGVYNAMSLLELENALNKEAQQAADIIGQTIHAKAYRNQDNYTAVILEF